MSISARPNAQPLVPVAVYSQPLVPKIGEKPGAGSVSVPENVALEVIVPRSSIADPLPVLELKNRSVKPSLKRTEPLNGRTSVVGGFCQVLVPALTLPSAPTSRCVVSTCPLARPPLQARVEVLCSVTDQFPDACDCDTVPDPPGTPKMESVVVSQAAVRASKLRQSTIRRTLDLHREMHAWLRTSARCNSFAVNSTRGNRPLLLS